MSEKHQRTRVLITVKTYPHPSRAYKELVCTAGITDSLEWVRLYPISYRYMPQHQQFHKYDRIEVDLAPRGSGNDQRKESRKPDMNSIKVIGSLARDKQWSARRAVIDKMPVHTVKELRQLYKADRTSLGIVKPTAIRDLEVEETDRKWKAEWEILYSQLPLIGDRLKRLAKIPYKFSLVFECADSDKPHRCMIEDWELGALYLRNLENLRDEKLAVEETRRTYFRRTCGPDRDTKLFMGTTIRHASWIIIGVFYPPKSRQVEGQPPLLSPP